MPAEAASNGGPDFYAIGPGLEEPIAGDYPDPKTMETMARALDALANGRRPSVGDIAVMAAWFDSQHKKYGWPS